jgi:protein required for attachment to host cells
MSRFRIVVADQAEAIFYDTAAMGRRPREVARLSDPAAHLHAQDLVTDRPGRAFDRFGGGRHGMEEENDVRFQQAVKFARRIARRLDEGRRHEEFEQIIVVAGPPFLGLMRKTLSKPTRRLVVREINKDLVHSPVQNLVEHLPESDEELRPD